MALLLLLLFSLARVMLLALQVGIEVQELAECGEYQSVEVVHAIDSGCGGVLQLRQVCLCLRIYHQVHLAKCCQHWLWVARMSTIKESI